MKKLLFVTIMTLSFNSMASALLTAAVCTGTVEFDDESTKTTVYAQENHLNYCSDTGMDPNGALLFKNTDSSETEEDITMIGDTPSVMLSTISTDSSGLITTYSVTIDENESMKLVYNYIESKGTLTFTDGEGGEVTTEMECVIPQYNMDC